MSTFQAILVEGLFYENPDTGELFIEKDDGQHVSWMETIQPVLIPGQQIQLAIHHTPPDGLDPTLPGGGSCQWPSGVGCPIRHDLSPDRMLSFHMEGVLRAGSSIVAGPGSSAWTMKGFDGLWKELPLRGMPGHYGRVGAATLFEIEQMRNALAGLSGAATGMGASELEAMFQRLRDTSSK